MVYSRGAMNSGGPAGSEGALYSRCTKEPEEVTCTCWSDTYIPQASPQFRLLTWGPDSFETYGLRS